MSLTLLLHQWQGHQGPRFARHMASRVSTNCELSAHSEFVAFGVTAPRLFRRVTTVPSAFDVYPIEGSVIDRRLTRATTFAPTRQEQVNQLPIGSIPVPCLPLIHRCTNISLGFVKLLCKRPSMPFLSQFIGIGSRGTLPNARSPTSCPGPRI